MMGVVAEASLRAEKLPQCGIRVKDNFTSSICSGRHVQIFPHISHFFIPKIVYLFGNDLVRCRVSQQQRENI